MKSLIKGGTMATLRLGASPLLALFGASARIRGAPTPNRSARVKRSATYAAIAWPVSLVVGALALVYAPVVGDLAYVWRVDEEYSHGPLIVAISAYLVWRRRREIARVPSTPSSFGFLVILAGLSLLLIGRAAVFGYFMSSSLLVVLAGIILFLAGARMLRALAFPLLYLLFMIPLPYVIFDRIAFPLQHLAASVGAGALDLIGIPVLLMGNIIGLPAAQLGVTEACSGIRSLMSLGAIGTIYAYFTAVGCGRLLVVLSVIPIAVATNVARIALTGVLTEIFGVQAAMGFYHTFSGLVLFGAGVALLVCARATVSTLFGSADWRRVHAKHA